MLHVNAADFYHHAAAGYSVANAHSCTSIDYSEASGLQAAAGAASYNVADLLTTYYFLVKLVAKILVSLQLSLFY